MQSLRSNRRQTMVAYGFLLPTLLVLGIFHFIPMVQAFYLSLWHYFPNSPTNRFVGLENFARLLGDRNFWSAFFNTLQYLLVVPILIVLSLGLAILVEPKLPFMHAFRAAFYVPVVTMMVVVAYAWSLVFDTDNGLLNTLLIEWGIRQQGIPWLTDPRFALWTVMSVTIWKGLGYYMVMFIVGLKAVPRELVEAARIDGANRWQVFTGVTLPSLWPIISLVAIISSISALKVFEEIFMMTRGRIGTSTLVYEMYESGFDMQYGGGLEMGYACAMGVVLFLMVLIFSIFLIRMMDRQYRS